MSERDAISILTDALAATQGRMEAAEAMTRTRYWDGHYMSAEEIKALIAEVGNIREWKARAEAAEAVIEQVRAFAVDEYLRTAQEVLRDVLDLLPEVTP